MVGGVILRMSVIECLLSAFRFTIDLIIAGHKKFRKSDGGCSAKV